jgi:hypothetical protein
MSQQQQLWYVTKNGQQFGPYTVPQLKELAESGQLQQADLLWTEGWNEWRPVSTTALGRHIAQYFSASASSSPPPPQAHPVPDMIDVAQVARPVSAIPSSEPGLLHWAKKHPVALAITAGASLLILLALVILSLTSQHVSNSSSSATKSVGPHGEKLLVERDGESYFHYYLDKTGKQVRHGHADITVNAGRGRRVTEYDDGKVQWRKEYDEAGRVFYQYTRLKGDVYKVVYSEWYPGGMRLRHEIYTATWDNGKLTLVEHELSLLALWHPNGQRMLIREQIGETITYQKQWTEVGQLVVERGKPTSLVKEVP